MAISAVFGRPFAYQVNFFRGKLNLPTARYDDIMYGGHDRAFMVAGAMEADLLQDLRDAVDAAISQGETLEQFRARFQEIVDKHGWHGWTGEGTQAGFDWRTKVIYNTNLRASYAAGRWQQLQEQAARGLTFWRYVHNDSVAHPRPLHQAWGDSHLTLPYDDPFWLTHYPPNGWGCRCRIVAERKPGADATTSRPDGWDTLDAKTGEPLGIDKGWGYAPGASIDQTFTDLIDQKLIKLDAPIGAAMMEALGPQLLAERTAEFGEWANTVALTGKTGVAYRVVSAIEPELLDKMASKNVIPAGAEIAVRDEDVLHAFRDSKQKREGTVPWEWYKLLPVNLATRRAVILDMSDSAKPALLYVFDLDGETAKLVLKLDYSVTLRDPDGVKRARPLNILRTGVMIREISAMRQPGYDVIEGSLE